MAVFENREQEQKLNNIYVLFQVYGNGRALGLIIWRLKGPRVSNYGCLAAARMADDAMAGAFVVSCLVRGGYTADVMASGGRARILV